MATMTVSEEITRMYGDVIKENPLLNAEQELELAESIINDKPDKQMARDALLKANIRLVIKLARQCNKKDVPLMDLISGGVQGLISAIDRFNPLEYKTRLSTYATLWIKNHINKAILEHYSDVHIPQNVISNSKKYQKLIEETPNISKEELMDRLEISEKGLDNVENCHTSVISLSYSLGPDYSDSTLEDTIGDVNAVIADAETKKHEDRDMLLKALSELDEVSRAILNARYLSGEDETLESIGNRYGLCKERIRQKQNEALAKMKKKMERMTSWGC